MASITFEYGNKFYNVPLEWSTIEWWQGQGFTREEARQAQKAFRVYIINLEEDSSVEKSRQRMHETRTEIISKTRIYLAGLYTWSEDQHKEYIDEMNALKELHNLYAFNCNGCYL